LERQKVKKISGTRLAVLIGTPTFLMRLRDRDFINTICIKISNPRDQNLSKMGASTKADRSLIGEKGENSL
jgi:hypothetical protein